jgi:hypothetical protein
MDMLDADKLLPTITQAPKNLNLRRISSHQTSRSRSEGCNSPLCSAGDIQLGKDGHGGCVSAGHLYGKRCLNFVLRRGVKFGRKT